MSTVCVLHVDDDPGFVDLSAEYLGRGNRGFTILTETDVGDATVRLESEHVDCIVSDYEMPGTDGLAFLKMVREFDPDLPFILFTGKGSEEIASAAISAGVTDYLQKGRGREQYTILANRIQNAVDAYRTIQNLERRSRQYEAVAVLGREALEGADTKALFDLACSSLTACLGTEFSKVLELSPAGDYLTLVAARGFEQELVGTETVGTENESQAGYTLSVSEPIIVEDLQTEERFMGPPLLSDRNIKSGISVIIGSFDDPWGILGTHTTDRRAFTDEDVTFVQNVANVLASAVENRRTVQELRESERLFRGLAELSPDVIFRTDETGLFTYISPVIESRFGFPPEELLGTRFEQHIVASERTLVRDGFERVRQGEKASNIELGFVDCNGSLVAVEVSLGPGLNHEGLVCVQGVIRDISSPWDRYQPARKRSNR